MKANRAEPEGATTRRNLRAYARWLRGSPLHPWWLMPKRAVDAQIRACRGTVLYIGAADRWLHSKLAPEATYIALDYPTTAIGLYGTCPDGFGDARSLPFATTSIDAVTCYEVLEHVRDPVQVLVQIARVLSPGGVAELTMPFL